MSMPPNFHPPRFPRIFCWLIGADFCSFRLAGVNFCLAIVGVVQVSRILSWRSSQTGSPEEAVEVSKETEKRAAEGVKEEVKKEVKKAVA
jgi:Mitochondrial pyruvate carriers